MVKTFITQMENGGKMLAGPRVEAESFEECQAILYKEYKGHFELVGELLEESVDEDTGDTILLVNKLIK